MQILLLHAIVRFAQFTTNILQLLDPLSKHSQIIHAGSTKHLLLPVFVF